MSNPPRMASETLRIPSTSLVSGEDFRLALRRLGGGVTIVATTDAHQRPCGLMMTAVMSLSLDPPSMLIAINRLASALPSLLERGRFSINVIGAGEEQMCKLFAERATESRFVAGDWEAHASGVPVYRSAVAKIICDVDDIHYFGTHAIIRGLVCAADYAEEVGGLIYLNGQFRSTR